MVENRRRILVVANRTADSPQLLETLRRRAEGRAVSFTLLVPAVPHGLAWAADMKAGWVEAAARAGNAAARMRRLGLELDEVIVGDPDPYAAVGDVLHARELDEVIVSVLPRPVSSWLALGLSARLRRTIDLPVTQVSARQVPVPLPAAEREMLAA
jgi:hypothetical protein